MRTRSNEKEYIDLGSEYYTVEEYQNCLSLLGRIGRVLGGDRASLLAFKSLCPNPGSILDVGCGGGDAAAKYAKTFPNCQVVGIDTSAEAIQYAKQHDKNNLSFIHSSQPELQQEENSYDVVTATLVCHHLNDEELIAFLKNAKNVAKKCIILNDLHRNWLAYASFALVVPILFRNRLIWHDGLLSVKRGFKKRDWKKLLKQAGIENYTIKWRWAFRWVVTIPSTS